MAEYSGRLNTDGSLMGQLVPGRGVRVVSPVTVGSASLGVAGAIYQGKSYAVTLMRAQLRFAGRVVASVLRGDTVVAVTESVPLSVVVVESDAVSIKLSEVSL